MGVGLATALLVICIATSLCSDSRNLCSDGFLLGEEEADQSNTETSREKEKNSSSPTNSRRKPTTRRAGKKDTFQKEIEKWEEFYDDMKTYLTDGSLNPRNRASVLKQADAFFLNSDGQLFFTKTFRDSTLSLNLPVVRSYEERMQVCKRIHLSTGEECIHHRRDTMLELLGQQFYWKGQRRDVCQCVSVKKNLLKLGNLIVYVFRTLGSTNIKIINYMRVFPF